MANVYSYPSFRPKSSGKEHLHCVPSSCTYAYLETGSQPSSCTTRRDGTKSVELGLLFGFWIGCPLDGVGENRSICSVSTSSVVAVAFTPLWPRWIEGCYQWRLEASDWHHWRVKAVAPVLQLQPTQPQLELKSQIAQIFHRSIASVCEIGHVSSVLNIGDARIYFRCVKSMHFQFGASALPTRFR